jgi:hypothetical protein
VSRWPRGQQNYTECNFVRLGSETVECVKKVKRWEIRAMADLYDSVTDNEPLELLATKSVSRLFEAPGLFSTTTTGWPSGPEIFSATERAIRSIAPPVVAGTTIFTAREGHPCAAALYAAIASTAIERDSGAGRVLRASQGAKSGRDWPTIE